MLKIGYGINNVNNNLYNINNNMSENNNFNNPYIGNRTQNTIGQDWNNVIFSMGKVINSVSSQIKSKMKDYKIDEKLNRANDYLYEKKEKITHSEIFQNMKNKAENGIQIIKEKASGFYNIQHPNINENFNEDKSSDI
jgi:TPP-dependent 2-oxoacid decarboxylase